MIKKTVSLILAFALVIALLPGMNAQAATAIKVTNLSSSTKQLTKGSTFTLKTNYKASKLTFKSSKTSVATVSSAGKITAKAVGTAKITMTVKANTKVKKTITVKVVKNSAIKVTNVSDSNLILLKGDTFTLKTNYKASELSFASNCLDIKVSSTGKISANFSNEATITITLKRDKTIKKEINVVVNEGGYLPENSGYYKENIDWLSVDWSNPDGPSGRSSYSICYKESGYDDVVFNIDNLDSFMSPSTKWTDIIFNDDDSSLTFNNFKTFKDVKDINELSNAEIFEAWQSDSGWILDLSDSTEVIRTEDENYIRIYFSEIPDGVNATARCLLMQDKNTGNIVTITYVSKCGKFTTEEVFQSFETVTFGNFTEEDLRK